MRTAQFGFIAAHLFCIGVYGFSTRFWRRSPGEGKQPLTADPQA
jgi:hypothetical protein